MHRKNVILYICTHKNAEVAQLVELQPSKLVVASSSLVFRSKVSNESLGLFYFPKKTKSVSDSNSCSASSAVFSFHLSIPDLPENIFTFFPNPVQDILHIKINNPNPNVSLTVIDIAGNPVLNRIISEGENDIDLSGLHTGYYLLKIENGNGMALKSLMVINSTE